MMWGGIGLGICAVVIWAVVCILGEQIEELKKERAKLAVELDQERKQLWELGCRQAEQERELTTLLGRLAEGGKQVQQLINERDEIRQRWRNAHEWADSLALEVLNGQIGDLKLQQVPVAMYSQEHIRYHTAEGRDLRLRLMQESMPGRELETRVATMKRLEFSMVLWVDRFSPLPPFTTARRICRELEEALCDKIAKEAGR